MCVDSDMQGVGDLPLVSPSVARGTGEEPLPLSSPCTRSTGPCLTLATTPPTIKGSLVGGPHFPPREPSCSPQRDVLLERTATRQATEARVAPPQPQDPTPRPGLVRQTQQESPARGRTSLILN